MFSDLELLSIKISQTGARLQGGEEWEDGGRRRRAVYFFEYQQCSTLSSQTFLSVMLTFFCLLAQQYYSRILYMEFSLESFLQSWFQCTYVVMFVTMKTFMLHTFAYILEWDFYCFFPRLKFFLLPYLLRFGTLMPMERYAIWSFQCRACKNCHLCRPPWKCIPTSQEF